MPGERNSYYKETMLTNMQFDPVDELTDHLYNAYKTLSNGSEEIK